MSNENMYGMNNPNNGDNGSSGASDFEKAQNMRNRNASDMARNRQGSGQRRPQGAGQRRPGGAPQGQRRAQASRPEGAPGRERPARGPEGAPRRERPVGGPEGAPRRERPVGGPEGRPRRERPVGGPEGAPRRERPMGGPEGAPRRERPVGGPEGRPRRERPMGGPEGRPRRERPMGGPEGAPGRERPVGGPEGAPGRERAVGALGGYPEGMRNRPQRRPVNNQNNMMNGLHMDDAEQLELMHQMNMQDGIIDESMFSESELMMGEEFFDERELMMNGEFFNGEFDGEMEEELLMGHSREGMMSLGNENDMYEDFVITKNMMPVEEEPTDDLPFKAYWKPCLFAFLITFLIATPVFMVLKGMSSVGLIGDEKVYEQKYEVRTSEDPEAEITLNEDEISVAKLQSVNQYNKNVVNILLLGDDQKSTATGRGNTDSIMIMSINSEEKTLKLVSFLRDSYVQIPGFKPNKLNSAYQTGGASLIKSTLEQNFCIYIDGMVIIHFDTFSTVIDELGGITATLNKKEADFINLKTKHRYPDLTAGEMSMNGDQSLWFARIRKIDSDIYGTMDMGRTARQRFVVNQIYTRYKEQPINELLSTTQTILRYISVDKNLFANIPTLVETAASFNLDNLETYQCPSDNHYKFADVVLSNGSKMSVIKIDEHMTDIRDELHEFIYGDTNY